MTHYAEGDRIGSDTPWWTRLLRMLALHAALADGWAAQVDAVGALRADLAEHERLGDHQLARTCRDLLRRAGAPTRRGRGATPVPAALRAAGVTSREMDVLALVADGLSNAEVAAAALPLPAHGRDARGEPAGQDGFREPGPAAGALNSVAARSCRGAGSPIVVAMTHDILVVGAGPAGLATAITRRPRRRPGARRRAAPGHVDLPARHRRQHPDDGDLPLLGRRRPDPRGRAGACSRCARCRRRCGPRSRRACRSASRPTRAPCSPQSPSLPACVPQDHIEPVLLDHLRLLGGEVRFGVELVELVDRADGVHATLRDRATGAQERVAARFVVGADGPRGDVRRALGIGLTHARHARRVRQRDLPGRSRPGHRRPPLRALHHRAPGRGWRAGARRRTAAGATGGSGSPSAASRPPTSRRSGASS